MFRFVAALFLASLASMAAAGEGPALKGKLEGDVYTSPTGAFRIPVPALPALGGTVRDTDRVVIFRDNFGLMISVAAFPQDATQRWEFSTRGQKDYLIYFFSNLVLPDFRRVYPNTSVETAGFSPDLLEGVLFTYLLLPGGSMFNPPRLAGDSSELPVAKRGNAIFVRDGFTFVVSSELSEKVTEGKSFNKTPEQENKILRDRLVSIIGKIEFLPPTPQK